MKKKLIFHIGCSAGFYSEYLGLVFAYLYSKLNNIEFSIYSKDANFKYDKGWSDYFETFTSEAENEQHSIYNRRQKYPKLKAVIKSLVKTIVKNKKAPVWMYNRYKPKRLIEYIREKKFKKREKFDYYTFDLWDRFQKLNPHKNYSILRNKLIFNNETYTLKDLLQQTIFETYVFNAKTRTEMELLRNTLNLTEKYIGMHIRGGDKYKEEIVFEYREYFEKLKLINHSSINTIFILTDDYSIIMNIKSEYPEYTIFSLCEKSENGYHNTQFNTYNPTIKKNQLLKLFTSVDLLIKSELFIGVYNSNPDVFIDLVRSDNSYFVDMKVLNN